ncbi:MAG TPA: hypothetical protein VFG09_11355 [Thermodesulfovibrionales bacterium]|jgi:hypothetical protein|nr:hypothetical protein [Thermodesulfovibrionales bacterium]
MGRKFLSFAAFAATVSAVIVLFKILNWMPSIIEGGLLKRYGSIDEVRTKLQFTEIYVPSYFPQRFAWPPSSVLAQTSPYRAIVMEFRDREKGEVALTIVQSASESFRPDKQIVMVQTKERERYPLKGRDADLEVGVCKNEEPCSKISWKEGQYSITVTMKSVASDLTRLAESMIR